MLDDTLNHHIHILIAEHFGVQANEIAAETELRSVPLCCDDFDMLEIVMTIEDRFGIEIDDDAIEGLRTVGNVVAVVQGRVSA